MPALDEYNNIKAIVFDFDGTLIDSNEMKHEAFFELFPDEKRFRSVVAKVLSDMPEASRYKVLEIVLRKTNDIRFGQKLQAKKEQLARIYDNLATERAKTCPEIKGAFSLLQSAYEHYKLYLSSNTPKASLLNIVEYRGWNQLFKCIYGYPYGKKEALKTIIAESCYKPREILVVGDGESDYSAAESTGCLYYAVDKPDALLVLKGKLGLIKGE